jgi:hypothetical protein
VAISRRLRVEASRRLSPKMRESLCMSAPSLMISVAEY